VRIGTTEGLLANLTQDLTDYKKTEDQRDGLEEDRLNSAEQGIIANRNGLTTLKTANTEVRDHIKVLAGEVLDNKEQLKLEVAQTTKEIQKIEEEADEADDNVEDLRDVIEIIATMLNRTDLVVQMNSLEGKKEKNLANELRTLNETLEAEMANDQDLPAKLHQLISSENDRRTTVATMKAALDAISEQLNTTTMRLNDAEHDKSTIRKEESDTFDEVTKRLATVEAARNEDEKMMEIMQDQLELAGEGKALDPDAIALLRRSRNKTLEVGEMTSLREYVDNLISKLNATVAAQNTGVNITELTERMGNFQNEYQQAINDTAEMIMQSQEAREQKNDGKIH